MALHLLRSGLELRPISDLNDPVAAETAGPAVVFAAEGAAMNSPAEVLHSGRPQAYRESGGEWVHIGYEAADHWTQLTPELQRRLITDSKAQFNVEEFKTATNGGSASIITSNWVYSGSPRLYRVAGQLRELSEVLAEIVPVTTG